MPLYDGAAVQNLRCTAGDLELSATRLAALVTETGTPTLALLAALYFGRGRGGLVERWRRYLERRIGEGRLRACRTSRSSAGAASAATFLMRRAARSPNGGRNPSPGAKESSRSQPGTARPEPGADPSRVGL